MGGRQPVAGTSHSVGFTAKVVTVQSVTADGKTALTVDRQGTQVEVPLLVQRAKGSLPEPGETWVITQDLGQWTFASFVGESAGDFFRSSSVSSDVVISTTAPANPSKGLLWLNPNDGTALVWDGTAWEPFQVGTGGIQSGAITAELIEAGIVIAGIVNGTVVTGAQIVADGTSGNLLVYSGIPATGNLIGSISPVAGADSFGNSYPAGIQVTAPSGQGIYITQNRLDSLVQSWSPGTGAAVVQSAVQALSGASSETEPAYLASVAFSEGTSSEQLGTLLVSQLTARQSWTGLLLTSEAADASANASIVLAYLSYLSSGNYRLHRMLALYPASGQAVLGPGMGIFASTPGTDTTESWNGMFLINGWTNNFPGEYGPAYAWLGLRGGSIGFRGVLQVPSGGLGNPFAVLAGGYAPPVNARWAARNLTHTSDVVYGVVRSSGQLFIVGTASPGDQIDIMGMVFTG